MTPEFALNYDILFLVHLAVNSWIFAICIRRLDRMREVLIRVKAQYIILTVASLANGLSPIFFKQWPTLVSIFYAGAVLYMLASDSFQWRFGPPASAKTEESKSHAT